MFQCQNREEKTWEKVTEKKREKKEDIEVGGDVKKKHTRKRIQVLSVQEDCVLCGCVCVICKENEGCVKNYF